VNSEGMGHATRSCGVIDYLLKKGHEVHIFTSDRAYDYLSKKFKNIYRVKGFHVIYHNDSVRNFHSAVFLLKTLDKDLVTTYHFLKESINKIKPHVIISDFESLTAFMGKKAGIPVISCNNISIINRTNIDMRLLIKLYPKLFNFTAEILQTFDSDYYFIPTFFYPEVKYHNVFLTDPVVRKEICKLRPKYGNHILVYQTSSTNVRLLNLLKKIKDEKFIVYGYGKRKTDKNLIFHEFNETKFLIHFANAKAVFMGGSFSLLSEALYLKKPIVSVPLRMHFEQMVNAFYVEKCGYGKYHEVLSEKNVYDFLENIDVYKNNLKKYNFSPTQFSEKIEAMVRIIGKEPDEKNIRKLYKYTAIKRMILLSLVATMFQAQLRGAKDILKTNPLKVLKMDYKPLSHLTGYPRKVYKNISNFIVNDKKKK